jgi:hypothetical protein
MKMSIRLRTRFLIFLLPCLALLLSHRPACGQELQAMKASEDTLNSILARLNKAGDDSMRYILNEEFSRNLYKALLVPGSGGYPFESIKSLVKASSDDGKFKIYHWNLPSANGKNRYFGFLKYLDREVPAVWPLADFTDSIPSPDTAVLDCSHWFGALYYKVISCKTAGGKPYYTLLGWAGNNARITRKVIEILSFDEKHIPRFGLPVFPGYEDGKRTRVVFRFGATASMSLKYEEQSVKTDRTWNAARREFDEKPRNALMIVFDRLVPMDPTLEGQYEFYVTSGDVCDGFLPENGTWKFVRGVEPKNRR